MHPFTFIKHPDSPTLSSFINNINPNKAPAWPPHLIDYNHKDFIWTEYHTTRKFMLYVLNDKSNNVGYESNLAKYFYHYFIKGYESSKSRPPLRFLKESLDKVAFEHEEEKVKSKKIELKLKESDDWLRAH